jgi:hypothetical protein
MRVCSVAFSMAGCCFPVSLFRSWEWSLTSRHLRQRRRGGNITPRKGCQHPRFAADKSCTHPQSGCLPETMFAVVWYGKARPAEKIRTSWALMQFLGF